MPDIIDHITTANEGGQSAPFGVFGPVNNFGVPTLITTQAPVGATSEFLAGWNAFATMAGVLVQVGLLSTVQTRGKQLARALKGVRRAGAKAHAEAFEIGRRRAISTANRILLDRRLGEQNEDRWDEERGGFHG